MGLFGLIVVQTTDKIIAEVPSYYGISRVDDGFGKNLAKAHSGDRLRPEPTFAVAEAMEIHLPDEAGDAECRAEAKEDDADGHDSGTPEGDQEDMDESDIL